MTPTITDDELVMIIFATVDSKVVRSWPYTVTNRPMQMAKAREYAEGWHNAIAHQGTRQCQP